MDWQYSTQHTNKNTTVILLMAKNDVRRHVANQQWGGGYYVP